MIHNFESGIKKIDCDPAIKEYLKKLYEAEEGGLQDPSKVPTLTYYENMIEEHYKQYTSSKKEEVMTE